MNEKLAETLAVSDTAESADAEDQNRAEADAEDQNRAEEAETESSAESAEDPSDSVADESTDAERSGNDDRKRLKLPASRRGRVLMAAILVMILGLGTGAFVWKPWASLPDGAVLAIGDRVVLQEELDQRVDTLRALYGVVPPDDPAKLDGFRRDAAKSIAVSVILDRAAAERKIVTSDKQARDVLDRYVAEQFEGGRDAFVRALGNVGTSERKVLDEIKRQLALGRLMDQVIGEVQVSDQQLRAEFDKRKEQLGTPERRKLRNMVLGSEQAARAALDRVRGGEPFADVATQVSLDKSTKASGGLLGELTRQQLEGPVGDAAFAAKKGEYYGPVKGKFGWNVGRVDEVLAPVPAKFDEVRDDLRNTLRTEESLARWRAWLGEQIRAAEVQYADKYRPADPDAAPAVNAPGANVPRPPR